MLLRPFNGVDTQRPSFFEMVYQEEITSSFKPALTWIIDVLAVRHQTFRYFQQHLDEVYLLLSVFIEKRSLTALDASFSENLYLLKRHSSLRKKGGLSNQERALSLFFLTLFPYLKGKLDAWYLANNPQVTRRILQPSSNRSQNENLSHLTPLQKAVVRVYPYINFVYQALIMVYQVAYLYERTKYYSPILHLLKIEVRRASAEDMLLDQNRLEKQRRTAVGRIQGNSIFATLLRNFVNTWYFLSNQTANIIPVIFILFRFFAWWYSVENQLPTKSLPIPPPPEKVQRAAGGIEPNLAGNMCPLCRSHRTNPTMCPSGYVFCYPCIHDYVSQYNRCPVTHLATSVDVLRKLYEAS